MEAVRLRTELHPRYVFQAEHIAVLVGTDHHVAELLFADKATLILHRVLERVVRVFTERTRGRLDVLLAEHSRDVRRHESVLRHHVGLEPDAHAVRVAHLHHVAHALDTLDLRDDVDVKVIREEMLVILPVRTRQGVDLEEARLSLLCAHADARHLGREQPLSARHAVLHVHRGHVRIRPLLEIHRDRGRAAVCGRGRHVDHVLHAVDVLF